VSFEDIHCGFAKCNQETFAFFKSQPASKSKKRVGTFFNVLSSQTPYQEFAYVNGCSQTFLNEFALGGKGVLDNSRRNLEKVVTGRR